MSDKKLCEAMQEYLEHLRTEGKGERTLYTYDRDVQQIIGFFGNEKKLSAVLTPHVSKFLTSDALLKLPSGRQRAPITVRKTIRVLRMFLVWAKDRGYIAKLPIPRDMPLGRSMKTQSGSGGGESNGATADE